MHLFWRFFCFILLTLCCVHLLVDGAAALPSSRLCFGIPVPLFALSRLLLFVAECCGVPLSWCCLGVVIVFTFIVFMFIVFTFIVFTFIVFIVLPHR